MTLEQFCDLAGCVVSVNPDPAGWGGTYRYHHRRSGAGRGAEMCGVA